MKKKVAIVFGHQSNTGSVAKNALLKTGHRIIPVDYTIIDFNQDNADQQINSLLTNSQPDTIINCAHVFENGYSASHAKIMNVNFGSNWSIVRHYLNPENQKQATRIVMFGHSDQQSHVLNNASKSAVNSLWQSATDALTNTKIAVDLINLGEPFQLDFDILTDRIVELIQKNQIGRCIDMTFKETK